MSALKKPKGLGRGLDALLGASPTEQAEEVAAAAARPKTTLPIEFLKPNPDQPRRVFNEDALEELAHSIRMRGLLQPILVRPLGGDDYEIVAGERRWRAAQKAQLHEVPVVIKDLTDEQASEIALIENVQRVDLNPVEEARAYKRLADVYGRSHEEIARAVGKSRSHIANLVRLLDLPDMPLTALLKGEITMGHARAMLTAPRPEAVLLVVLKNNLSVRETEALVADAKQIAKEKGIGGGESAGKTSSSVPGKSAGGKKDADTRALEADLAAALGLEVAIEHSPKGHGVMLVKYLNLDQLDDVCRRLMGAGV
ncbi:MAG: ParB/RepB/Spo0J family partition protein [Pseudomonadota bacterium]|nr:ParB/RepB/Spo0J family partition protein [Pseudomonadota bacterium]